jgi:predicted DNA binding protein
MQQLEDEFISELFTNLHLKRAIDLTSEEEELLRHAYRIGYEQGKIEELSKN